MKSIRGIDEELYRQGRAQAVAEGKTFGQWLNEAIRDKLKRTEKRGIKIIAIPSPLRHERPSDTT